jgi:hypothetical protein
MSKFNHSAGKRARQRWPLKSQQVERGQRLVRRACRLHPGGADPVDALMTMCADPNWVLRPHTTRVYKRAIIAVIEAEVTAGCCDPDRAIEAIEQISCSLVERRARVLPRTSAKKEMSVTPGQARAIQQDLRRRQLAKETDLTDCAVRRFVDVAPRFGLRPCEWARARIIGTTLVVLNAKRGHGRAPGIVRRISMQRLHPGLIWATAELIGLIAKLADEYGSWEKLHKVLAERLARICRRLGLPRLAPYSFRHTAIATWKRAGMEPVAIASLAGHISINTARRHYAPAKHGWGPEYVNVRAHPRTIAVVQEHMANASQTAFPEPWCPPEGWGQPAAALMR